MRQKVSPGRRRMAALIRAIKPSGPHAVAEPKFLLPVVVLPGGCKIFGKLRARACARYGVLVVGEEMKGSRTRLRADVSARASGLAKRPALLPDRRAGWKSTVVERVSRCVLSSYMVRVEHWSKIPRGRSDPRDLSQCQRGSVVARS